MLGDIKSACHILQHMVVLAAQNSDHLRVSCKRRYQSSRFDIPVPAMSESDYLKILLDFNLPLSQEKPTARKYSIDVQPELFREKTKSLENVHMDAYVPSSGPLCCFCLIFAYAIRSINIFMATRYIKLILFQFYFRSQSS